MWGDGMIGNQDYVASIIDRGDGFAVELVSFAPGPAGVDEMSLPNGITVSFDHAQPERAHRIVIEPNADRSAVATLLGYDMAEGVEEFRASGSSRPRRMVANTGADIGTDPDARRRVPTDSRLGAVTALTTVALHEGELPLVRVAAAIDLAHRVATDTSMHRVVPPDTAARATRYARDVVDGCDPQSWQRSVQRLFSRNPKAFDALANRLLGSLRDVSSVGRDAEELKEHLESHVRNRPAAFEDEFPRAAAFMMAPVAAQSLQFAMDPFERDQSPPSPVRDEVTIVLESPGRITVRGPDLTPESWVRILRQGDQELLAVVPVHHDGDGHIAEAIIPPDLDAHDLIADIVGADTGAVSAFELIERAVDLGRDAVAADISGRPSRDAWMACADAWGLARDTSRARRALAYAKGSERTSRRGTIADDVRAAVGP